MSRRIDIELTSSREDGTWTWRAAGAKQPKGVVAASMLPATASVGDVLRAEIDSGLDGTEVLSVMLPKAKKDSAGERIELIGRTVSDDQLVTTVLAGRGGRRDRGDRGDRRERRDRGDRGDRSDRSERGERRGGDRNARSEGDRPSGDRRSRGGRDGGDRPRRERPAPPARPKAKRLRPGRAHRKAALAALAPEEQVIAEHLLRGGIPAVRQEVEKQNAAAKAEGRPLVQAPALLAVAEKLLPALRVAEWRDRAEAAVADLEELDLRDLRSVIVAADTAARDDDTRALADQLRAGLTRRVEAEHQSWLNEIQTNLSEGRVVRALRLSSRPPKAGAPLPNELASALVDAATSSLTAETLADRWSTVLDALSFSPIRAQVVPASRPDQPGEDLIKVITTFAGRLPRIAESFGITPPPPAPPTKRTRGPKRPASKTPAGAPAAETVPVVADNPAEATGGDLTPVESVPPDLAPEVATQPSASEDAPAEEPAEPVTTPPASVETESPEDAGQN